MRRSAVGTMVIVFVCLLSAALLIVQIGSRRAGLGTGPVILKEADSTATSRFDDHELEQIRAIPYLNWQETEADDPRVAGVTLHIPERAFPGLNLYNIDGDNRAVLVDMRGKRVHSWHYPGPGWHHVELGDDGILYVIIQNERLLKLDRDSRLIWDREGRYHHDLDQTPQGIVYAIKHQPRNIVHEGELLPVLDDVIVTMTGAGEVTEEISMWDLFGERVFGRKLTLIQDYLKTHSPSKDSQVFAALGIACDLFHTNSVEVLRDGLSGLAERGDLLVSLREINTIAIVNPERREVLWSWGAGEVWRQHHPSALDSGNILLFDNGTRRDSSRVLELDPLCEEVVWTYGRKTGESFFSQIRGACQRLGNGNTLVTHSDKGRVFEVTPEGDLVWEYWSEVDPSGEKRRAIYRMVRLPGEDW